MPEPDLPDHVLAAIERRVKRRVRRHVTMTLLTLALVFLMWRTSTLSSLAIRHEWESVFWFVLFVWIPYTIWYIYQALVERGVRREVERQFGSAAKAGKRKRQDPADDFDAERRRLRLFDDGKLFDKEADLLSTDKPKRELPF